MQLQICVKMAVGWKQRTWTDRTQKCWELFLFLLWLSEFINIRTFFWILAVFLQFNFSACYESIYFLLMFAVLTTENLEELGIRMCFSFSFFLNFFYAHHRCHKKASKETNDIYHIEAFAFMIRTLSKIVKHFWQYRKTGWKLLIFSLISSK